ncbi:MAG: toll/interleukin-1 receptor domain-containing protein, partial [Synergistaceae bacterium]|nr:toll/interleukin-1 receptor domain-containing protein [Synergistaceae bacterium]
MESKGFEYFAFISYSHKDQELAKRLKKRLQSYHLPSRLRKSYPGLPKKLRPVFLDESSLVSIDESLQKSLYINLDNSNYLIVICSPNSAQSVYVNDEVKHFIETGKIAHIVPLIVEGVPHSGDEATECFPPAIRNLPREQELLGVDLTKFGERDAFLRVIATMLGLNLDRFVQDEIRERRRKIAIFSSIAAVLVITFGMLFWHNIDFFHAMLHNASSQYNLGEMYFYGREVEKDYGKAMEWYQRAAANGNSNAQFSIGYMYQNGLGVAQDYVKAMEWYEKAVSNGNVTAQHNIGWMYYQGQDYAKALEWFEKAASNGFAAAQSCIGDMYYQGYGVKQDYTKAME